MGTSYWAQVERGTSAPTAPVLLRMALSCDASPEEIAEVFDAAGYRHLFDTLTGLGRTQRGLQDGGPLVAILSVTR